MISHTKHRFLQNLLKLRHHEYLRIEEKLYSLKVKHTVGENIIATIKMRNNFCSSLKMVIFPISQ